MKLLLIYICTFLLVMTPVALFAGDGHDHDEKSEQSENKKQDDHGDEHGDEEKIVTMTNEELVEFGVFLSKAGSGVIRKEIVVPGEIAVNSDRLAHIVPRFTGIIKDVRKKVGDPVKKGEVLAIVESNESLKAYEVKALMDGTVIDKDATIGEVHSTDMPAFLIADLDTVWVNLSIYQVHLPFVKLGQDVIVTLGHGQKSQEGKISYISPLVDEHTRTATARVVLDNKSGEWRPGLLIEGIIGISTSEASIVIPKTALQRIDEVDIVFLQSDEGFIPQPVVIGRSNHSSVEIVHGLTEGQTYVSKGGLTLKSELQKGSFGEGHSH